MPRVGIEGLQPAGPAAGGPTDQPLARLLALIPELEVNNIDEGCSGMAGAFGLTRENFETSLKIGEPLMRHLRESTNLDVGVTECNSCRIQMEQGAPLATVHPLKLLALSYGLMPELQDRFQPSRNPLLTS